METLLLENIIKDLKIVLKFQKRRTLSWYAGYFTPPIVFAIILGTLFKYPCKMFVLEESLRDNNV